MPNLNFKYKNKYIRVNVWEYDILEGCKIIAGKSDKDNELLSLNIAEPDDWWFHVRGSSGSHVILKVKSPDLINQKILKLTAAVAAYHSKSRNNKTVKVSGTLSKFVKKIKGSNLGTVVIRKEKVFKVKPFIPK